MSFCRDPTGSEFLDFVSGQGVTQPTDQLADVPMGYAPSEPGGRDFKSDFSGAGDQSAGQSTDAKTDYVSSVRVFRPNHAVRQLSS